LRLPNISNAGTIWPDEEFSGQSKTEFMQSRERERKRAMDGSIRRQIGSDANRSYLRALPVFRIQSDLPQTFIALLDRLDRAEEQRSERRD